MSAGSDDRETPPFGDPDTDAAPLADRGAVLSVIKRFWQAMDARDTAAAALLVSEDAVSIDAFAPHIWSGSGAFDRWLEALWAFCADQEIAVASTALRDPSRCLITAGHAYVVSPAIMASARNRDLVSQPGVMTMTLRSEGGRWLVGGMCWAGQ